MIIGSSLSTKILGKVSKSLLKRGLDLMDFLGLSVITGD